MKVLLANKFFYLKGGSEYVFFESARIFKERGDSVSFFSMKHPKNISTEYSKYFVSNVDYEKGGIKNMLVASLKLLYSIESMKKIEELLRDDKPDIAHLHNIHHQISPSIIKSLKKQNIPVIVTLHDYKMVCAIYSMISNGKVCEACKNGRYYKCFMKSCVKESRMKSLINTIEMYLHHKILHIYDSVDIFISPSIFLKNKVKEMGFKGRIEHLPNFVNVHDYEPSFIGSENAIVYFGRLSKEKGLFTLIDAVKGLRIKLKIIGEGPMKADLETMVMNKKINNVDFLGYREGDALKDEIRKSQFIVLPSEWYENNPRSLIEGFALGKPALCARIGGISELVQDDKTGLTFESGNSDDLRDKISKLVSNASQLEHMGRNARKMAEEEFNPEIHYQRLMEIYKQAIHHNWQ